MLFRLSLSPTESYGTSAGLRRLASIPEISSKYNSPKIAEDIKEALAEKRNAVAARINPFALESGRVPPVMAGYGNAIESIEDAFRNGPGDPNLTGIFDGARETGKTALLTPLADAAEERVWIAARVSAVPGMLEDILVQAEKGSLTMCLAHVSAL